jgi:hypothetical protein
MSKKSRRRPILVKDVDNMDTEIKWVGPDSPSPKYIPYLRLEDCDGRYLGALSERQMRRLRGWLNTYYRGRA